MIKGRIIVCVASSWDYDPTGKHQLMKILSRHNDIVWIDYHGTRRPTITKADLKAGWSVLRRFACGLRRVSPSIVRVTPLVIPGATRSLLRKVHEWMLIAQIRRAVGVFARSRDKPLQVWSFAPDVPYLVGQFDEECFLYYCVDEHSAFEGMDADYIRVAEQELIERADVVVTTSQPLLKAKGVLRSDIALVRHGVDYDHFSRAWSTPGGVRPPKDIASVPEPIFGFFGLIQFWIDCRLMAEVAKLRPHYSFVLIGDCQVDVSNLKRLPNVFLLGRRPYDLLPAYCAAFQAGLLPFVCTAMTQYVSPIKMFEYLAAGLPVVSTPLPEAERFRSSIAIADTAEAFSKACDRVLATDYPGRRKTVSKTVASESWLSKVEYLSDMIMNRVGSPMRAASMPVEKVIIPTTTDALKTSDIAGLPTTVGPPDETRCPRTAV